MRLTAPELALGRLPGGHRVQHLRRYQDCFLLRACRKHAVDFCTRAARILQQRLPDRLLYTRSSALRSGSTASRARRIVSAVEYARTRSTMLHAVGFSAAAGDITKRSSVSDTSSLRAVSITPTPAFPPELCTQKTSTGQSKTAAFTEWWRRRPHRLRSRSGGAPAIKARPCERFSR